MPGLQPVHRAVLYPRVGAHGGIRGEKAWHVCRDRSHSRSSRRSRTTLLQRKAFEADRPRLAATPTFGFDARFTHEHHHEIPRSRGRYAQAAAGELARTEERSPHACDHDDKIRSLRFPRGAFAIKGREGKRGVRIASGISALISVAFDGCARRNFQMRERPRHPARPQLSVGTAGAPSSLLARGSAGVLRNKPAPGISYAVFCLKKKIIA